MATELSVTTDFGQSPAAVLAKLADERVLARVMSESESLDPAIEISTQEDRAEIRISRGFEQDWPGLVATFIGKRLLIEEVRIWQRVAADDWQGTLHMRAPGQPVELQATMSLLGQAGGSRLSVNGKVRCTVPFIGGAVEQMARGIIVDAINHEFAVVAEESSR